ncbi:MAG: pre-16S rRNA-processing nuclease YqgF [Armatimonadetes bacterium]|nr:pre-16S rRNA-processing nuclease YqgF [Armatimonadota bacterium]
MINSVLAIDPGRAKCGIAIVSREEGVLAQAIVRVDDLPSTARLLALRFKPDVIVIGAGTGARFVKTIVARFGDTPYYFVDERMSTQKARARYFKDHPPTGWRRLVPRSLLVPDRPYDDYAAIRLAEDFLRGNHEQGPAASKG